MKWMSPAVGRLRSRWIAVVVVTCSSFSLTGSPASAHAKPNKSAFPAGSTHDVSFTIEHGCGASPTVQVAIRVPVGVKVVTALPVRGWKSSHDVTKRTITWTGGVLPASKAGKFAVRMTFPKTRGVLLSFPMVQTCKVGTLRWIEGPASEYPAPTVKLT
jgi:periplasmic copper chaperone A